MKFFVNAFFAITIVICASTAAKAEDNQPLMVVRFNQNHVGYQSKLAEVINQAQKVKQNVVFDVVDVTPSNQISGLHGQEVVDSITKNGVPSAQVTLRSESGAINNEEVRIFVR